MTKYKAYFKKMLDANKKSFDDFRKIHDKYTLDPDNYQEDYNIEGEIILEIIRDWENKLCMQSEKGGYGVFTTKLAEKFHDEIKKEFPMVDHIGLKIEKAISVSDTAFNPAFVLKKINLS